MNPETPFRLALLGVFALTLAIAGYHRYCASRSHERISRRDEGRWLFLAIRLAGLSLFVSTLTYLVYPPAMAWSQIPLMQGARWLGLAVAIFSVGLLFCTLSALGKNLTDTVAVRANHSLVLTGPYRWVRHPYYVSFGLLIVSAMLLSANWFVGATGFLALALLVIRTPIEEQMLVKRFGKDYLVYMEKTPRFIPTIWRSHSQEPLVDHLRKE